MYFSKSIANQTILALVVWFFVVYSEANIKDNDDYIYRHLCIGLRYEEIDAVTLIEELEKVRGKLNFLDVNADVLKDIFKKIMGQDGRSVSKARLTFTSGKPDEDYTTRLLKNYFGQRRRLADEHWVEIANGVHKTELSDTPPDHLKNRLLHLLELKEKMKNW